MGVPAIESLFPSDPQLRLFDPGEIEWLVPKMLGPRHLRRHGWPEDDPADRLLYELNWRVAEAWNERWQGKKVRILTPDSGVTEGYCGGVGGGFLGPCVTINTSPGSSLCCDPRSVIRIREINYFPGEESFRDEEEDGEGLAEGQADRADGGEAGAAVHDRAA